MLKIYIASFLIFLSGANCFGQSGKIYVSMDDISPYVKSHLTKNSIENVKLIYGDEIYPDNPYVVNEAVLTKAILREFPDKNAAGLGVLDWEGKAWHALAHKTPSSKEFKISKTGFLKALKIAKRLRPNIKWGFYGIPFHRANYKNDISWENNNNYISELLAEVDAFYPSFYRTGSISLERNKLAANNIRTSLYDFYTQRILKLSQLYNKEVYPFVWHRYIGQNRNYRFKKLSFKEFSTTIRDVLDANYNQRSVKGIIWWSKDTYFYKGKNAIVLSEASNYDKFKTEYDRMIVDYLKRLKLLY